MTSLRETIQKSFTLVHKVMAMKKKSEPLSQWMPLQNGSRVLGNCIWIYALEDDWKTSRKWVIAFSVKNLFLRFRNELELWMLISSLFHSHITFGKKAFLKATVLVFSREVLKVECVWILLVEWGIIEKRYKCVLLIGYQGLFQKLKATFCGDIKGHFFL